MKERAPRELISRGSNFDWIEFIAKSNPIGREYLSILL